MGYLSLSEAAISSGFSIELLEKLTSYSPKPGIQRKLKFKRIDGAKHIDDAELSSYLAFLNEPWPCPNGERPTIPTYIQEDVRRECHFQCAVCGSMDNGELAHIDPVATSHSNSPDNLILLCPNHHTEYDFGHRPSSNLDRKAVHSAKCLKRQSRRRMIRFEANVVGALRTLLKSIENIKNKLASETNPDQISVYGTEITTLIKSVPDLHQEALSSAGRDRDLEPLQPWLVAVAPKLAGFTNVSNTELAVESAEFLDEDQLDDLLPDFDEVDWTRCHGSGFTGWAGDFCAYCRGSCFVTSEKAEDYDPEEIDEVDCPRCHGSGFTGRAGDFCAYCRGSCLVSGEEAEHYDPNEIDEVDCPRCAGSGFTGRTGDLCAYCRGSCYVSSEEAEGYDPDEIDEVDCPRCAGSGFTGRAGDFCAYCRGSCYVSREEAEEYDPEEVGEVDCPRCHGSGFAGASNDYYCAYCHGSCFVSPEMAANYEPDDIDQVDCPRCSGGGRTGWRGDACGLCKGAGFVDRKRRKAYIKRIQG